MSSTNLMRSTLAVITALGLALIGVVNSTEVAQAATTQRICSSSNSQYRDTSFQVGQNFNGYLDAGQCFAKVAKGTRIYMWPDSYQVGYDYGPYSGCRAGNTNFIPYQTADVIYFKMFDFPGCSNQN